MQSLKFVTTFKMFLLFRNNLRLLNVRLKAPDFTKAHLEESRIIYYKLREIFILGILYDFARLKAKFKNISGKILPGCFDDTFSTR